MNQTVTLYLAAADYASAYRAEHLDAADCRRLAAHPQRAVQTDWQVSRALKQNAGAVLSSLSHSGGHAVAAAGNGRIGVDLEVLKPRDFSAWADWVLAADEPQWLAEQGDGSTVHYALWTLKEALVKAAGLTLADMAAVGVFRQPEGWRLRACGADWRGRVWLLAGGFLLACVWDGATEPNWHWQTFGMWQPQPEVLYRFD